MNFQKLPWCISEQNKNKQTEKNITKPNKKKTRKKTETKKGPKE